MPEINFDYFDPLTGDPPNYLRGVFDNLIWRSRKLLRNISKAELETGLETLNAIFSKHAGLALELLGEEAYRADYTAGRIDSSDESVSLENNGLLSNKSFSSARVLYEAKARYELDLEDDTLDWIHYFAILALAEVNEAIWQIEDHKNRRKDRISDRDEDRFIIAGLYISDIIEALVIAEYYQRENEVTQKVKDKLSLRNTVASYKKHDPTNVILYELRDRWNEGEYETYADLVTLYLSVTPEEKVHHIKETNRYRTLTQGLSAVLKGKRKSFIEYERKLAKNS